VPDQPPDAEHASTAVLVHEMMLVPPADTLPGEAVIVTRIQKDVAEIKADVKTLREKVEAGFTDIRQSIAQLSVAMEQAYGKRRRSQRSRPGYGD
jgi:hypothetical protein